jgi:AcrR family transcriptional regulator
MSAAKQGPKAQKAMFPTLTGGRNRMAPERVAQHQRSRLEGAMLEAVSQHGYPSTTLAELVALAGISKSDFYRHFDSKAACFLSTLDAIFTASAERVSGAYREDGDFRERLIAAMAAFMEIVVEEPGAASFATVESLSLGALGAAHRQRGSEAFELMFAQSFEHSPSGRTVSAITVRAIVAGIRGVVYRALRAKRQETLGDEVEALVDWALDYQRDETPAVKEAMAAGARPSKPLVVSGPAVDWSEPPDSLRSRDELSQRERIVRAAARVAVARGYEKLSIPTISAEAGTSNQTFYEHFRSKRDAFLAAFEMLGAECLQRTAAAFLAAETRPEAIGAAVRAMLEYVATNELFARLGFFELPAAGPAALDRADAVVDGFAALLAPPDPTAEAPVPGVLLDAISNGVWEVIQYEIAHGERESLPDRAPEITRIAMIPTRWTN